MSEHHVVLPCFGGRAAVHAGGASGPLAATLAAARLKRIHAALTRFEPSSELSRLNADPRPAVPASPLLRLLAEAVGLAGSLSGGLVDATRVGDLERAGYSASRVGEPGLPLVEIAAAAPAATPARPDPGAAWRAVRVDHAAGLIHRPPGLRLDSGGLGKGLAADVVGAALVGAPTWCVDCGGDLRLGGDAGRARRVLVDDPFGGDPLDELRVADGAVATSGIGRCAWRGPGGAPVHHLVDPATGRPAWTGVVQATALAPTALEAEIRAKAAVLAGPDAAAQHVAHGGVVVLADGEVRRIAALAAAAA
jgi:FAD:protein FMN transferase